MNDVTVSVEVTVDGGLLPRAVEAFNPNARCQPGVGGRYNVSRVFPDVDSAVAALRYIRRGSDG